MPKSKSTSSSEPLDSEPRSSASPSGANREIPAAVGEAGLPSDSPASRSLTRRQLFKRTLLAGSGLGAGTFAYSALFEPNHPRVERHTIQIQNLPPGFDGMRVVALSDLHIQPDFPASRLGPALRLVEQERPDAIFLLGDYVNVQKADRQRHMASCAQALSVLRAPLGIYACFGNHDFPVPPADPPRLMWEEAGIAPLSDAIAEIERGGERIFVVGLRSLLQRPVVPLDTLGRLPFDESKIVLWHEPDRAAQCAEAGAQLMLSGHTHGGQVRLPGFGLKLPAGGRLFPAGLYPVGRLAGGQMSLYVTRGVGLLPPMVRFNCPPEVTLLTLKRQEDKPRRA